jgi:hypothetical protein
MTALALTSLSMACTAQCQASKDPQRSPGGRFKHLENAVVNIRFEEMDIAIHEKAMLPNTKGAYVPKIKEFIAFCEYQYPNDPYKYILKHMRKSISLCFMWQQEHTGCSASV